MRQDTNGRFFEVDAVKFFAIIYMIFSHSYERFGAYDLYGTMPDTIFRNLIEFFGGPLAAPVFMFCMGIGMVFTRHSSPSDFIRRGFKLLITGYLLNFFRQTIPMLIAMALDIETGFSLIGGLLNVDILPFAGMAFITIGLMKKKGLPSSFMLVIALLFQAAGIWATKLKISSILVVTLLGLLIPSGDHVAFPMTLWLIYPVLGILFGECLKKTSDRSSPYKKLMVAAAVFFTAYSVALIFVGYDIRLFYSLYEGSYYFQTLLHTLWIAPLIVLTLGGCYFLLGGIGKTVFGKIIRYCSINLTTIYIIQWLLIGYGLGVAILLGFESTTSPLVISLIAICLMTSAVLISLICRKIKDRKKKSLLT